MKETLPIRAVSGNLILARESVWACFRVRCYSYRAETIKRRGTLARALIAYAKNSEADFQILRVSTRFDVDYYVDELRKSEPRNEHLALWRKYLEEQREMLGGIVSWTPSVYICVKLSEPERDFRGKTARLFEQTKGEIAESFLTRLRRSVPAYDYLHSQETANRARIAEQRLRGCLDAWPAKASEVQWLIRRAYCRGSVEPHAAPEEATGILHEEPERTVKRWFGENGIAHHQRYLQSIGEHGNSFQAGLCLGEMGHAQAFSREVELMFTALEEYPWPIDAALNVRYVPNDMALRRTSRQVARTRNALADEEMGVHGARMEGHRRVDLSEELHDRLTEFGEPIIEGTLSFMVSAESLDELNRRVRAMREGFPWPLYRPFGDQLRVWRQHLPGQPSQVRGYERPFTIEQVGAMVPHGTHEAGSRSGRSLYIARTIHGSHPVFMNLREGSGQNKAPTIALLGTLGGGKTMFLQLLLWHAFLQGARIVDVDPKGDHLFHTLPEVQRHAQSIYLGAGEQYAGMLDPLRVAPTGERHDAAATFLIDVLPQHVGAKVEAAISGAISRVLNAHGDRSCCVAVIEELAKGSREEEQDAAHMLKNYCEAGIAQLGFANLDTPLPTSSNSQIVYLNVRALKRSGHETVRSEMSQSQRHGRAVLQLVALYAMRILGEERNRLKVLAFDEASFLTEDALGHQLLDTLTRWARSELAVPILSSQLLGDVADKDNLIGWWFNFAMKSRDHALRALEAMEMDSEGQLADALMNYENGQALVRDLHGRCEEIQVDLGPRLLRQLSTTPVEENGVAHSLVEALK